MQSKSLISFVIPAKNEAENVEILYRELSSQLSKIKRPYEVIFIDDGSKDATFKLLVKLHTNDARVVVIRHRAWFGKSAALTSGFDAAKGEIIITMDADLQDNPKDIPAFLKKIDEGYDLVSGWKKKRHDPALRVLASRVAHLLVSTFTNVKLHDLNCGFKAYRKEVAKSLDLYGELYRFIPAMVLKDGYKVTEIPVTHRKRLHGKTKYGWGKMIKGFLDFITVVFLTGYLQRPGHFFGTLGLASFSSGFIIGLYIAYLRFTTGSIQYRHPLLFFGMLLMIIGVQLVSTGLLGEMMLNTSRASKKIASRISEKLV